MKPSRLSIVIVFATATLLGSLLAADRSETSRGRRVREGTTMTDRVGSITPAGDRFVFTPDDGGEAIRLLENLALERVTKILADSHNEKKWVVSGLVTEFKNANSLLMSKALVKEGS